VPVPVHRVLHAARESHLRCVEACIHEVPVARYHAIVGHLIEGALNGGRERSARFAADAPHTRLESLDGVDGVGDGILAMAS